MRKKLYEDSQTFADWRRRNAVAIVKDLGLKVTLEIPDEEGGEAVQFILLSHTQRVVEALTEGVTESDWRRKRLMEKEAEDLAAALGMKLVPLAAEAPPK